LNGPHRGSSDGGEDVVGRFDPAEGLRLAVTGS
jgi:hypothetical protein